MALLLSALLFLGLWMFTGMFVPVYRSINLASSTWLMSGTQSREHGTNGAAL